MNNSRIVVAALLLGLAMSMGAQTPRYDLLITNGTVIDGTGAPRTRRVGGWRDVHTGATGEGVEACCVELTSLHCPLPLPQNREVETN